MYRERARRRNCELDRGELSVVKMSPVKTKPRPVSLIRSPRPPPTLELDTVLEERSDPEQTTLSQVTIYLFVVYIGICCAVIWQYLGTKLRPDCFYSSLLS